ncbi:MAG: hypothetical protein M3Y83_16665 [Actinomycetota bacterium]|nr:hypothetical protein [Actinomycetota bacterium]
MPSVEMVCRHLTERDVGSILEQHRELQRSLFERSELPALIGREGGTAPCGEIGFLVDDVDAEADRLRGLSVELLTVPVDRPWRERTMYIAACPDGQLRRVRADPPYW